MKQRRFTDVKSLRAGANARQLQSGSIISAVRAGRAEDSGNIKGNWHAARKKRHEPERNET